MLTFRLTPYASADWSWTATAYTTADQTSRITPFVHPMTEQLAVTDGERTLLAVRERLAGRAPAAAEPRSVSPAVYDQARAAATSWPADYVRVTAGAARTTPLYLADAGESLHGS